MKAKEVVESIISYFKTEGNLPGIDIRRDVCLYYLSDQVKCAIGCIASDARALQRFSSKEQSLTVTGLAARAALYDNKEILTILQELLPEDLNYTDGLSFLDNIQDRHDGLAKIWSIQKRSSSKHPINFADSLERELNYLLKTIIERLQLNQEVNESPRISG